jgi:hypothetical protein
MGARWRNALRCAVSAHASSQNRTDPGACSVFRNSELVGGVPLQSFNFGVRPRGSADRDAGTGVAGSSGKPATASADESELGAVDLMTEARYACLRDFVLGRPTRSHLLGESWHGCLMQSSLCEPAVAVHRPRDDDAAAVHDLQEHDSRARGSDPVHRDSSVTRWRKLRAVILHDSEPLMQRQPVPWQLCSTSHLVAISSAAHKQRFARSTMTAQKRSVLPAPQRDLLCAPAELTQCRRPIRASTRVIATTVTEFSMCLLPSAILAEFLVRTHATLTGLLPLLLVAGHEL